MPIKKPVKPKKPESKIIQPDLSMGLVGHVDHGKSTLVQALTGKWTDTHSEELKRGITIRLGYADTSLYKCDKCKYYTTSEKCPKCKSNCTLIRKVSFVDAPGHESLMATMLSGAAIMDAALLIIAADEPCPQPQTEEHLKALELIGIKNIIIVQNKVDAVSKEQALKNYKEIQDFIKGTQFEDTLILPISAKLKVNIDKLIEQIARIKSPEKDLKKDPLMFIARSFDINKPGLDIKNLVGGVLGGTLKQGILKVGDEIEIKPGIKKEEYGKTFWRPIITKITGIKVSGQNVKEVAPGGSIGILTSLDPYLTKSDGLTGNLAGHKGKLPEISYELDLEPILLKRIVGSKDKLVVEPIKKSEYLMINVNSTATVGEVTELHKNKIHIKLKSPICAEKGSRITFSRMVGTRWRLIGWAVL
jgi:translation initiation factor 2 subunit 3